MRPNFFHHLHPPTIPAAQSRWRYTLGAGGTAIFLMLVLVITGALEMFYYIPTPTDAALSIQTITYLVPFGGLIRNIHFWSAQLFIIVSAVHLVRVVFTGAYIPPRRFNYLLGLALFVFSILLNFTGYILRWDTGIQWALVVGTNLIKTIPFFGNDLYTILIGGTEPGSATLIRFYAWHIYGLAIVTVILIGWHAFRVRRDGGIALPPPKLRTDHERISRFELVRRETLAMLLTSCRIDYSLSFFSRANCFTHHPTNRSFDRLACAVVLSLGSTNAQMGRSFHLGCTCSIYYFVDHCLDPIHFSKTNGKRAGTLVSEIQSIGSNHIGSDRLADHCAHHSWKFADFSKMRKLIVIASGILLLSLSLVWWLNSRQPKPVELIPTLTNQPEYCITCHADLPEISSSHPVKTFGCVSCHGGERLALDADLAHSTMRGGANPSDLSVVEMSCGGSNCHSGSEADDRDHIQRVMTSVQSTYAGAIANIRFTFGAQTDLTAHFGINAVTDEQTQTGITSLAAFDPTQREQSIHSKIWRELFDLSHQCCAARR